VSASLSALKHRRRVATNGFTLGVFALWLVASTLVPAYQMPEPIAVADRMASFFTNRFDFGHLVLSIAHVTASVVAAFILGITMALLAHYLPVLRLLIHGRLTPFLNSFSGIGWTLLAIVWFGVNDGTVIFAVTAVLIPLSIINMRESLQSLDNELLEMGRSFGRGALRNFVTIVLPSLAPFMFATLRVAFGVAWKVTLTAELFGGGGGLGYLVNVARQEFDTPLIFAAIGLIVVFVHAIDRYVLTPLQTHVFRRYRAA